MALIVKAGIHRNLRQGFGLIAQQPASQLESAGSQIRADRLTVGPAKNAVQVRSRHSDYAILLVGFPLEEGYAASIPTYGDQLSPVWETLRVTGREAIEVENGDTVDAWVVETELRPWTVWLTKDPPYIAKVVQRQPDGSEIVSERTWCVVLHRSAEPDRVK